jgi:hypothetical protein
VFLIDDGNRPLRQTAPALGAMDDLHRYFDACHRANDTFCAVNNIDGRFYASRIGGDTFLIDMTAGAASRGDSPGHAAGSRDCRSVRWPSIPILSERSVRRLYSMSAAKWDTPTVALVSPSQVRSGRLVRSFTTHI